MNPPGLAHLNQLLVQILVIANLLLLSGCLAGRGYKPPRERAARPLAPGARARTRDARGGPANLVDRARRFPARLLDRPRRWRQPRSRGGRGAHLSGAWGARARRGRNRRRAAHPGRRPGELRHTAAYEQTVLRALAGMENSMVSYAQKRERRDRLARSVEAAVREAELVRKRYRTGLTDLQNVLDTERSLFQQEDSLSESEGLVTQILISIYRALGGCWDTSQAAAAPAP